MKELYIPIRSTNFTEYIAISKNGIYLSSGFMKNNNLQERKFMCLYRISKGGIVNNYKFGLELVDDGKDGAYTLMRTARNNAGVSASAQQFLSDHFALKYIAKNGSRRQNRFKLKFDKSEDCFCFNIIPSFEYRSTPDDLPDYVTGIYRYLNQKEVIYIGKGNIKERVKSADRKDWGIQHVEYSVITDKDEMEKYESYHLREFESTYGRKPMHNLIHGKKFNYPLKFA